MNSVHTILSVFAIGLMGCSKPTQTKIAEVNLNEHSNTIVMSDFVTPTTFVTLEETDSCILRSVNKVVESKDALFILDITSQQVLKFDYNGRFQFKFGRQGNGPDEYTRVYDIALSDDQHIINLCVSNSEILAFDSTNGQLRERIQIDTEIPFSSIQIIGDEIVMAADDVPQDYDRLYTLSADFRLSNSFLSRGPGLTSSLCPQIKQVSDKIYFLDWYNNILYNYNPEEHDVDELVRFRLKNDIKSVGIKDFMWFMNRQHEVGFISNWGVSKSNIVVFSISDGKTNILIMDSNLTVAVNGRYSGLLPDLYSSADGQGFISAITYDNYNYYEEMLKNEVALPDFDDGKTNAILMFWHIKNGIK